MSGILDKFHLVKGLNPIADAFSGTVYSDVVRDLGEGLLFIIYKGVSTGGTDNATVTVQACDDTTPSTTSAVAFYYRACTSADTWGVWTPATAAAGFSITAGSSQMYMVYVPSAKLAEVGYGYGRLKSVEVTDDPVVGCILALVTDPRYSEQPQTLI